MRTCFMCGGPEHTGRCPITRRSFFAIGGGVALGVALAPAAKYWESYRFKCTTCPGHVETYSKVVADAMTRPIKARSYGSTTPPGYAWYTSGKFPETTTGEWNDPQRVHTVTPHPSRFTGTRNWLDNLKGIRDTGTALTAPRGVS